MLEAGSLHEEVTVTATGLPTPVQQSSAAVTLIPRAIWRRRLVWWTRCASLPAWMWCRPGRHGGVTSLFVRGGNSTANQVLIDGISADDVGGTFDFGTVSSTGLAGLEVYRGPNSALYGTDAGASVVNLETPRGSGHQAGRSTTPATRATFTPIATRSSLSGTHQKFDYYTAFSRFDTSNALPLDEYHSATSVANIGYSITANTQARFTLRNADSAIGLPGAHDFYGISANGKESDQDLYSGADAGEPSGERMAQPRPLRHRAQARAGACSSANVGTPITLTSDRRLACGATASQSTSATSSRFVAQTATPQPARPRSSVPNDDQDSNRDELTTSPTTALPTI